MKEITKVLEERPELFNLIKLVIENPDLTERAIAELTELNNSH